MVTYIGVSLVIASIIMILCCLLRKDEPFFNLRKVISEHLGLFKNCPSQYIVFYGIPLLFAVGLSMIYQAGAAFYSELSIVLGILLSMLLAMMSILSGYDFSTIQDEKQRKKGIEGVKQAVNAILFDSMLIIGLLLYGLTIIVVSGSTLPSVLYSIKPVASGLAYYIFFVILLNLVLIIKHLSNLVAFNFSVKRGPENDSSGIKK